MAHAGSARRASPHLHQRPLTSLRHTKAVAGTWPQPRLTSTSPAISSFVISLLDLKPLRGSRTIDLTMNADRSSLTSSPCSAHAKTISRIMLLMICTPQREGGGSVRSPRQATRPRRQCPPLVFWGLGSAHKQCVDRLLASGYRRAEPPRTFRYCAHAPMLHGS